MRKLLYKFYEPYRIRHGFGLSPIRNQRELKALIDFCEKQLSCKFIDPKFERVYKDTLKLYNSDEPIVIEIDGLPYSDVYDFIEDHTGWYWS